ncbi:hypothetical protein [Pendulispora albinea]|uniref:Uncharacterized protein n=1 Tax=Pendulispora albinea TaxID=2741071 RepID=A0ABZ2M3B0_9BACT
MDYPCLGTATPPALFLESGTTRTPLYPSAAQQTVQAFGNGQLHVLDSSPDITRRMVFSGTCHLTVKSVTVLPSNNTIRLWTTEAKGQARIIGLARDLYLLSKNFVAIATFNREQLGVVIDATDKRVAAATTSIERRKWLALYDSLVAMRDGQPIPVPKEQVDQYLADLAAHARTDLLTEADKGRAMVQRFEKWEQAVEATLKEVLDSLPAA